MNEKEFLENDRVINFKLNTGGSEPIYFNAIIEIKDKKIYVTGTTQLFYQPIIKYVNSLLRDSEIKSLFRYCKLYNLHTEKKICERLLYMYYR